MIRLPDLEDALLLAGRVLGVERDGVELLLRIDRLVLALLTPATRVDGVPVYRSAGRQLAALWVSCALSGGVPRKSVRFGWLMVQRALALNGYGLRKHRGDTALLKQFGALLSEGQDPGDGLARWFEERLERRPTPASHPDCTLHVSGPICGLGGTEKTVVAHWATEVDEAVCELAAALKGERNIRTIRPQVYPYTTDGVAELATVMDERLRDADAIIALMYASSNGAAIEIEMALRSLKPTLVLHPKGVDIGNRLRARIQEAGAICRAFPYDEDRPASADAPIRALVRQWLRRELPAICDSTRARMIRQTRRSRFMAAVRSAAGQLPRMEWRMRLRAVGLSEERANALIRADAPSGSVSLEEFEALSAVSRVPANLDAVVEEMANDRPPYLAASELNMLREVVAVDEISASEVVDMVELSQYELRRQSSRRKSFGSDTSWRAVRTRLHKAR